MKNRFLTIVVCAMTALTIVACGANKADVAKQKAQEELTQLVTVKSLTGLEAEAKAAGIYKILDEAKLQVTDIGVDQHVLSDAVGDAWFRKSEQTYKQFIRSTAAPQDAEELRGKFLAELKQSGRSLEDFRTSEKQMSQVIARNGVEHTRKTGGTVTSAMLVNAGMPVPTKTVVRTRTIIKRVPVVRAARAKPTKPTVKPAPRRRT